MKRDPYLFETRYGLKSIDLVQGDITALEERVDIITFSGFRKGYKPTTGTIVKALADKGIKVWEIVEQPELDLRKSKCVWLSPKLENDKINAERLACIELIWTQELHLELIKAKLKSLYGMLAAAQYCGINVRSIAIPLFGGHYTSVDHELMLTCMMEESKLALETINNFERVIIVIYHDRDYELAEQVFDRVLGRTNLNIANVGAEFSLSDLKNNIVNDINVICEKFAPAQRQDAYVQREIINDMYNQKGFAICMAARKLLELFINNLCRKYELSDNATLLDKINGLSKIIKFPSIIYSYMHVIRIVGNHSAHTGNNLEDSYKLSTEDIRIMLLALAAFTRYYRNKM